MRNARSSCTQLAAKLSAHARIAGRQFQAWTSTSANPVVNRFVKGTKPYVRPAGVNRIIANNWTDLTDGAIALAIFHDEEGKTVNAGGANVWTGTAPDGKFLGPNCDDWSSADSLARVGVVAGAAGNWSSFGTAACGSKVIRLYCFEK
jgi:hypothetical protein